MSNLCPCGTGRTYDLCCGPHISGKVPAPTAESLMRSRYSAYVKHEIDFLVKSCVSDEEAAVDIEETRTWSEQSEWLGLTIVRTEKGGIDDKEGLVEFAATYIYKGKKEVHHEVSAFVKKQGRWLYDTGRLVTDTVVRAAPKVGRNDPCTCGSGKKYKQCCGKNA